MEGKNKMAGKTDNYPVKEKVNIGDVRISDEVVVTIAALAVNEVEGVVQFINTTSSEGISKMGVGKLSKAVKIHVENGSVDVYLKISVKESFSIPETSKKVQDKVQSAIETMCGLKVSSVNIKVSRVSLENV